MIQKMGLKLPLGRSNLLVAKAEGQNGRRAAQELEEPAVSTVIWECYGLKVPITTHIEIEPPF
jgi:hypothetical protein